MKKLVGFITFFLLMAIYSKAQNYDSTLLTYTDGFGKFEKLIGQETSIADVTQTDSFHKKQYLFYQVMFKVDRNGAIGDIWINSLYDSVLFSSILSAIKKSNGRWVNHSGGS